MIDNQCLINFLFFQAFGKEFGKRDVVENQQVGRLINFFWFFLPKNKKRIFFIFLEGKVGKAKNRLNRLPQLIINDLHF